MLMTIIIIRYSFLYRMFWSILAVSTQVLVHVGFPCELGLLSNFDENSCSYCHKVYAV